MPNDAPIEENESPNADGTPQGSQGQEGTDDPETVASYKRRQAGAEAARQAAEKRAADAQRELDTLKAQLNRDANAGKPEADVLREQLEAERRRADEAEANAAKRVLDHRFPAARAKFPEITDEVRLAELETFYAEPTNAEPPTPRGNNGPRTPGGEQPNPANMTSDQLFAQIKRQGLPWDPGE